VVHGQQLTLLTNDDSAATGLRDFVKQGNAKCTSGVEINQRRSELNRLGKAIVPFEPEHPVLDVELPLDLEMASLGGLHSLLVSPGDAFHAKVLHQVRQRRCDAAAFRARVLERVAQRRDAGDAYHKQAMQRRIAIDKELESE
jgi:hypothetical protein